MYVRDFMTKDPITVTPEDSLADASSLLREHRIRRLPVVENGRLVGIVALSDILKASPSEATTLSVWEIHYLLARLKIKDIMKTKLITVKAEDPLEKAALLMRRHDIGALPVLDAQGKLVGIITESDIFDAFLDLMGLGEPGLRLTVELEDRPGALLNVVQPIKALNLNIVSLATFRGRREGYREVVLRIQTTDPEPLLKRLEAEGVRVVHYEVF